MFSEPPEVRQRLRELGLELEDLYDSILVGDAAGRGCTVFFPQQAAGFIRWAHSVAELRERLSQAGWTLDDDCNLPRIVSPDGAIAIAVSTGDELTGDLLHAPSTRYRRGPASRRAVQINGQLSIFALLPGQTDGPVERESRRTYLLLIHIEGEDIRAELSLPRRIREDGGVADYTERIILPPIERGTLPGLRVLPAEPPPVDVDVRRRAE
jgi:hypothetical protein